jgi:protein gp37
MYFKSQLLKDDWDDWEYLPTQDDVYSTFWVGTSTEDQEQANKRIPHLISIPAAKRFVSVEPMLGPVDLTQFVWTDINDNIVQSSENKIDCVICGGESGQQATALHPNQVRALRDQCSAAGIPFFFKQWGEWMTTEDAIFRGEKFVKQIARKRMHTFEDGIRMVRAGKKNAGRLLDGKEHLGWPV